MGLGLGAQLEPHQMGSRGEPQGTANPLSCLAQVRGSSRTYLSTESGCGGGGMQGSGLQAWKAIEGTSLSDLPR